MIAEAIRRSPLTDYAERFAAVFEATSGAMSIREQQFVTQINLRVDLRDAVVMQRLKSLLGFAPPLTPNTVATSGDLRILWVGPDEWLIVGGADQAKAIEQPLREAVAGASASVVDVSASRTVLLIQGELAREVLAHGIAIDLHPRAFPPGRCAQTRLVKAPVIIERSADGTFNLYVHTSFATFLADWLLDASWDGAQGQERN